MNEDTFVDFEMVERPDFNFFYSEGVMKALGLLGHGVKTEDLVVAIGRKAVERLPLEFPETDDPIASAANLNNLHRVNLKGMEDLIFTAATYEGKPSVFCFIWREIKREEMRDGQQRRKN